MINSEDRITLNSGWNLISLPMKNTEAGTDRNISLVAGWNLIGYAGDENLTLDNAKFTNSSGTQYTWANAVANNKVQAYLSYYDSSASAKSQRKYKYVASSDLGMDDTKLVKGKGYWVYANQSGNLTLTGVGGRGRARRILGAS